MFGYISKNQNIYIFRYTLRPCGSQLAKAHDINDGDETEIIPMGIGEFKIRKLKK